MKHPANTSHKKKGLKKHNKELKTLLKSKKRPKPRGKIKMGKKG